jgi:hypothetical protein
MLPFSEFGRVPCIRSLTLIQQTCSGSLHQVPEIRFPCAELGAAVASGRERTWISEGASAMVTRKGDKRGLNEKRERAIPLQQRRRSGGGEASHCDQELSAAKARSKLR